MLERLFPQQADDKLFVEDVFSTWLYTGNSSTQTITNGIDLAGKGGLVWLKARNSAENNFLFDTNRGVQKRLVSNSTADQFELSDGLSAFNSNGFTLGSGYTANGSGLTLASWTFRKAPKFFDVVTYTGNGSVRTIPHNLGVAPGMIFIKSTSEANIWVVYHRSIGATKYMVLNVTQGESTYSPYFNNTEPTASVFTLGNDQFDVNKIGTQYVAYLFAHDPSADGIIQCGSFTTDSGGNFSVSLGWEPQWVMVKRTDATQNWFTADTMRGFSQTQFNTINPNLSAAEAANTSNYIAPNATGFGSIGNQFLSGSATYIYMAIRRGPMRTPTLGTSVFSPVLQNGGTTTITTNFPVDLNINGLPSAGGNPKYVADRLRGGSINSYRLLETTSTAAEASGTGLGMAFDNNTGVSVANFWSGNSVVWWNFRRAPGFMDVVCRTGNGTSGSKSHGLGVVPELIIEKPRTFTSGVPDWAVWQPSSTYVGYLNLSIAFFNNGSSPATATTYTPIYDNSGSTYVAYLFASVPGVSKVGSYTGNGSSQTINCAFTTGARFVLIKRTDSTGDWYVWDSARGIVAGNDPYLALNSTAAEVTSNDSVDTDNTGFIVNQVAASNINVNAATYIFLAIA